MKSSRRMCKRHLKVDQAACAHGRHYKVDGNELSMMRAKLDVIELIVCRHSVDLSDDVAGPSSVVNRKPKSLR